MESSSSSFSNEFPLGPAESSARKARISPRKRLVFYLFFQLILLAGSLSAALMSGLSFGTGGTLSLLFLLVGAGNFVLLADRKVIAYRLEYFRILLSFVLIISLIQETPGFRDSLFLASGMTFLSLLWLKVIRPVFKD